MKKGLWNKRIPTFAAFLLLFGGVFLTSFFIQKQTVFFGRAAPANEPRNIIISNVTDTSFTVAFTTEQDSKSAVSGQGGTGSPFLVYDVRDKDGENNAYSSHFIKVSNLSPNTSYTFSILSEGETYNNNGKPYSVKTGPAIEPSTREGQINGKVLSADGQAASGVIVEMIAPDAQVVTTLSNGDGKFTFEENSIRNTALTSFYTFESSKNAQIKVYSGTDSAEANISLGSTTIAPITLTQNYDFTFIESQVTSTGASQLKAPEDTNTTGQVKITVPRQNQSFVDTRPQFSGVALPNKIVKVSLSSGGATSVTSSTNGFWSYRPENTLAPGNYTLTIQSPDQVGISVTDAHDFSIFASGSQVSDNATPSATPRATSTPTPTKAQTTPTPTIIPSVTPTLAPSTTPLPTVTPTLIPSATVAPTILPTNVPTATPFTKPPSITPPPTGNAGALILTTISVLLIFAGSALLFIL